MAEFLSSFKNNMINPSLIAEPPATGVENLVAVPEFTSVTLTWTAVSGATNYNVGWRSVGSSDWTTVSRARAFEIFTPLGASLWI